MYIFKANQNQNKQAKNKTNRTQHNNKDENKQTSQETLMYLPYRLLFIIVKGLNPGVISK